MDHFTNTPEAQRHYGSYLLSVNAISEARAARDGSALARASARRDFHLAKLVEGGWDPREMKEMWSVASRAAALASRRAHAHAGSTASEVRKLKPGQTHNVARGVNVHHDPTHGYSVMAGGRVVSRHGADANAAAARAHKVAARRSAVRAMPSRQRHARLGEAADSMRKASEHEPVGKPGGPGLWRKKGLQLPAYIQHIANDLREKRGMSTGHAIATAINAVKRWAKGGGKVDAGTKAAAIKALAEWEALKLRHSALQEAELIEAIVKESA